VDKRSRTLQNLIHISPRCAGTAYAFPAAGRVSGSNLFGGRWNRNARCVPVAFLLDPSTVGVPAHTVPLFAKSSLQDIVLANVGGLISRCGLSSRG
jgi:hypothetical protein